MLLIGQDSAAGRREGGLDAVLGEEDGEFYELAVHGLDCLLIVASKGLLKGQRHVLVNHVQRSLPLLDTAQIDGILVGDVLERIDLHHQFLVLLLAPEEIPFFDENLA